MAVSVVDASVVAALLFGEPAAGALTERLGVGPFAAPALLEYEVANVCWHKCRQQPAAAAALRQAFGLLAEMDLQLHDVDHSAVLDLALETGLTGYDASYLWLARQLGVPLVTLDRRLMAVSPGDR